MALFTAMIIGCAPKASELEEIIYGPISMVYELPDVPGKTYFVAPDGNPDAIGTDITAPTTIEMAITRVVTGDAIVMRGGTYRTGNLTFNQGITIQPYRDERPVLKGTHVADQWQSIGDTLWVTNWPYLFPADTEPWWRRDREEKFTPMHRFNNDVVFIDGQFLQSAGNKSEINEGTFFVDYIANQIYIGLDPKDKFIEITAYRQAIFRTTADVHGKTCDGRGPVIRGLEITQYPDTMVLIEGFDPQGISDANIHGKDVVGTVFENNIFSYGFRIGVFSIGDSLVMRNNEIRNTNTEGLYIIASSDVLLERNIFANNNIERWTGFFPAAVKIFNQSHRVVVRENLVVDHPYSNGIWYDVGNKDGIFVNNHLENIGRIDSLFRDDQVWPSKNAFFFEISEGVICAGNVFVNCNQGILILNAKRARVYNNTLINSKATFGRNARGDGVDHFGWHITTGPAVDDRYNHEFANNLIVVDQPYPKPLLYVWHPANMCERLTNSQLNVLDYNVYVRRPASGAGPLMLWSPADNERCQAVINNIEEFRSLYPEFSANCTFHGDYEGIVFMDVQNGDFSLSREFRRKHKASAIPEDIAEAMGLKNPRQRFVGAVAPR